MEICQLYRNTTHYLHPIHSRAPCRIYREMWKHATKMILYVDNYEFMLRNNNSCIVTIRVYLLGRNIYIYWTACNIRGACVCIISVKMWYFHFTLGDTIKKKKRRSELFRMKKEKPKKKREDIWWIITCIDDFMTSVRHFTKGL